MFIPPTTPTSVLFRALLTLSAVAFTPFHVVTAQGLPLPVWEQSVGGNGLEGSLFPPALRPQGDIFQGATDRPIIDVSSSQSFVGPAGPDLAIPKGVFSAAGDSAGTIGDALSEAAGTMPGVVQAGAQAVAAVGAGRGFGNFGQGQPNLQGILQGLGGNMAAGALGNGIGVGPFGQFMGSNNQIMQGLAFISLLQQLFGGFGFFDGSQQFNNSNTGQSARTAFVNLMGANGGSSFPSFPQQFGVGMTAGVRGDFSNITAVDLEGFLPTNLKPYAQDFVDAGRAYQLDPRFLASISRVETGDGTSRAFLNGNNAMGISTSSGPVYGFGSVRDSIMRQSATLANPQGPYRGANTVQEIGSIYAPVGASNDFNGTNGGWASEVGGFYSRMRST